MCVLSFCRWLGESSMMIAYLLFAHFHCYVCHVYIILPSYIYPFSSGGHLGCFQVFAVTLRDSLNIQEHVSLKSRALAKPFHILLLSHHFSPVSAPEKHPFPKAKLLGCRVVLLWFPLLRLLTSFIASSPYSLITCWHFSSSCFPFIF